MLIIFVLILIATAVSWKLFTQKSPALHPGTNILMIIFLMISMVREQRDILEVIRKQDLLAVANKQIDYGYKVTRL